MAAPLQQRGELITGINVTPLVDVVLVLLIVLMVAASYTVSRALMVDLPKAETGESPKATPLAITIDSSGALYLEGTALSSEALRQRVRAYRQENGTNAILAADGSTSHRAVVGVMDLLRAEGVTQFAINVSPGDLVP